MMGRNGWGRVRVREIGANSSRVWSVVQHLPACLHLFFSLSIAPSTNFYYTYVKDITISLIFKRGKFLSPRFNGKGEREKGKSNISYKICSHPFRYFISEIKHESSPEEGRKNKGKEKVSQVSFLPSIK